MYYAHVKIKSRLVLRLLEYLSTGSVSGVPGLVSNKAFPLWRLTFFPGLFVCFFFLWVEGVEALGMIFGREGEGDFCYHSTTLFAQSPQDPSG